MLGMALVGGSLWLLSAVARADQGRMAWPDADSRLHYTPRRFARYGLFYAASGVLLIALGAIAKPVSTLLTLVGLVPLTLVADAYLLRLAWHVRPRRTPHLMRPDAAI
ncbi:MAG: hypothetical protein Kow00106_18630 [Anaerolineae bacterium]